MADHDDLADLSLVGHLLQNRLAAVTGAASLLQHADTLNQEQRDELLAVVERSAAGLRPAIQMLQHGLPAAALMELQDAPPIPHRSSGVVAPYDVPPDDDARVAALARYDVLDRPALPELERITRLAAGAAGGGGSAAFVNLIDADRQWQAAATGAERAEVPRCDAMCNVTVVRRAPVVVSDAAADPIFSASPWVTGLLGEVRLYASLPLVTSDEHVIGTLCVVDGVPRTLDDAAVAALTDLAALTVSVLEARRAGQQLRELLQAQLR